MMRSSIRVPFQVLVGEVARRGNDASLADCEHLITGLSAWKVVDMSPVNKTIDSSISCPTLCKLRLQG